MTGKEDDVNSNEPEGFDRVFTLIGGHHRYQWLLLGILGIGSTTAFHHMGYTFLGSVPDHWCKINELSDVDWTPENIKNISIPRRTPGGNYDQCSYYDLNYTLIKSRSANYEHAYAGVDFTQVGTKSCSEWMYDTSIYKSTIVAEFNLVCNRKYLTGTIQASYMSGVIAGSAVLGAASDRILGRRGCIMFATTCILVGGFGAWLSPSYLVFIFFRFIIAIGASGNYQNKMTIMMEYCDASSRATFSFVMNLPFCAVFMSMALYAYLLRDWRDLQLAFTLSTLVIISYYWIVPESSRWLASKDRDEEAFKMLEKIARFNKRPVPDRAELTSILECCKNKAEKDEDFEVSQMPLAKRTLIGLQRFFSNYLNLVRTPELRRRTLVLWILFISVTLVYYGIIFESPTLSDDPFMIVFLGALVEVPANLGAIPLAKWGRKPATALTFLVCGFALITLIFVPAGQPWLRISLSLVGKLCISACYSVIFLLATELYPTSERVTGFASCALVSRIGAILAPFIGITRSIYPDLPTIIIGIASLFSGLIALLLPETKNMEMLEQVTQVEQVASRIRSGSQTADGVSAALKNSSLRKESIPLDVVDGPQNQCAGGQNCVNNK